MCFCATASFAASGGLVVIGVASIAAAKKDERFLALIPLLFAVQQLIEGFQWIVPHPSDQSLLLGYAYLLFALLLWPIYSPLTVYHLEKNQKRRQVLRWFIGAGTLVSLGMLFSLFTQPLTIKILPKGIDYSIIAPFAWLGVLCYAAVTNGSLFFSSQKFIRRFGIALLASFLLSAWIYEETITSVWCFFSAILSISVFFYIRQRNKATKHPTR